MIGSTNSSLDVKTDSKYQSMSIGSGTSNSTAELILPSDGKYLIVARAWWTSNSTGSRYIGLLVNNQSQHWMDSRTSYDESYATFSIVWEDNAGTSLKALGYQNSGSTLTMYVNMQYVKLG